MRTLLSLLFAVSLASSQTGTGNIQGTVTDATGAVIPKAKVGVTHPATARQYTTETNEVGFFLFPALPSGLYELTVESSGMTTWKGTLTLAAGQSAAVPITLATGTTSTAVTVGDVTPLVNTTNATIATVVERERIEQLPLNGRFITTLIGMTTPGVESGSVPRVYGLRYATELLQDGAILENREWQSIPARPPGLDTIGEFRSETNNSSAKLNRPGTFMVTTRSGTNEIHGAVFETARNSGLGVARARQDFFTKPPQLIRNEFGASVGAPIWIPKLYNGKNRTFFFFAYEGYQLRQGSTRQIAVPTEAMRNGDFSGLVDGAGRRFTIYDPQSTGAAPTWTRTPFTGNVIPQARQTPLSKYLYSVTPLPTRADNPLVASNWFGPDFNKTEQHTETLRIDHKVNDANHLFFRYSHSPGTTARTNDPFGGSPTTLDQRANAFIDTQANDSGVANWTHTFSPTFFGETLVSVARDYRGQLPFTGTEEIASGLGLPNPFNGVGFPRMPNTVLPGGGGMAYDSSINPTINYGKLINVDQNFTKIRGRHEFLFGARFRYEWLDTLNDQQISQGQVDFANSAPTGLYDPTSGTAFAATPFTGHTSANFYMGLGTYQARFNRSWYRPRNQERALYFQDNWKVNSRLTVNLGLRWEYNMPINDRDRTLLGFDEKNKKVILPRSIEELAQLKVVLPSIVNTYTQLGMKFTTAQEAGLPDNLVYSNKWDFGPRAGFAYRLNSGGKAMVLRSGYSLFAYPESLRLFSGQMANSMPGLGTITYNPNAGEQSPDGLPNYLLRSVPSIIAGVNSKDALNINNVSGITRGSGSMYFLDPRQPTARAHEWNMFLEREILQNTVVKVGYVGTHGIRMSQFYSFNDNAPAYVWYNTTKQPFPTGAFSGVARRPYDQELYGTMQRYQKTGWSNFNGIQAEIEHRYSKGYAFQLFYVMSNALRAAGDGWRDDTLRAPNVFSPGIVPTDDAARNRLLNYRRDAGIPKHRLNWNFLVDVPIGRGKMIAGNSGKLVNALIGGWQLAGNGSLVSRYFQLPTGNWGPINGVEKYGKQYPIQDCRSGVCYDGWLYWNGYIPANRINSVDPRTGRPNGVMGVPDSYRPFQTPIIPIPKDGGSASDPNFGFYDTNTVSIQLANGILQRTNLDTGLHPLQNQFVLAPMLWNMAASVFKAVDIKEGVVLRVNADFLNNVFNMPGTNTPGGDGIILNRTSANAPRVLQLTMRLTF